MHWGRKYSDISNNFLNTDIVDEQVFCVNAKMTEDHLFNDILQIMEDALFIILWYTWLLVVGMFATF